VTKRRPQVSLIAYIAVVTVLACMGAFGVVLARSFLHARESARRSACIGNLRQVTAAKDQYAMEYGCTPTTVLSSAQIGIYIKDMRKCYCPSAPGDERSFSNSYSINALTSDPTCKLHPRTHRLGWAGYR
jgi:hypothetical protein